MASSCSRREAKPAGWAKCGNGTSPAAHSVTHSKATHTRFAHEGAILRIAFSSDGKTLASSADDHTVKLWDAIELKEKLSLEKQPDWPSALAFALADKAVVVGRLDGTTEFYDANNGKVLPPPKPELARAEPRGIQRGTKLP